MAICKHDTLAIEKRDGVWVHLNTGKALCRPAHGNHPAGPYVAEPYHEEDK